jgi:hypothetical protein
MPIISALRRLRQEDLEFEASLNYIARSSQKKKRGRNEDIRQDSTSA